MHSLQRILLILTLATSNIAFGHAVVTHNSLKLKPVPVNQASQVELSFNSKVELDLSEVFLVSAGDVMTPVSASLGAKPGQVLLDLPALAPGEYAIKLKIFAADGHLSEDLLRFFVKEPK
ncbi:MULTISPECIES: copper resistance protein CopC [Methylomonas]|uniref:Copper resistance protein CopC n=1 Tax=Methylomonas koyamae TaxID=702114 RepID=A0A177NY41_9GAMM|nr:MULTISPECIES: copper resistance protein CopC [Methylomonas]NJA07469.1 copper resistance protein CopC [Methylococcaceae bacterium WWC4]OAI22831.1 copper resistance protein CopC [Methylomonas koyamae]WGS87528.1 copper resistance protein CopC [Methylomonas sp. UP202]